jgi:hypothetical protein
MPHLSLHLLKLLSHLLKLLSLILIGLLQLLILIHNALQRIAGIYDSWRNYGIVRSEVST